MENDDLHLIHSVIRMCPHSRGISVEWVDVLFCSIYPPSCSDFMRAGTVVALLLNIVLACLPVSVWLEWLCYIYTINHSFF